MASRRRILTALVSTALAVVVSAGSASAGSGWTVVTVPEPTASGYLLGVDARTDSDAWAVGVAVKANAGGTRPGALIDHWNGTNWQSVATPNVGNLSLNVDAVSASSSADAWAVGYSSVSRYQFNPFALHWNGSSWTVNSPSGIGIGAYLYGVADISPTDAWAIGDTNTRGVLEHWDGANWTQVATPEPNPAEPNHLQSFQAISATSANDVWLVGIYYKTIQGQFTAQTMTEHFDGSSWSVITMPLAVVTPDFVNYRFNSIDALSPNNVWVAGESGPSASSGFTGTATLVEHWDGSSWSIVTSPTPGTGPYLSGISSRGGSDVWAVGQITPSGGGPVQALSLHWDGTAWSSVATPGVGATRVLAAVSSRAGAARVWAVGRTSGSSSQPLVLLHS
jgi:hypothetical protein